MRTTRPAAAAVLLLGALLPGALLPGALLLTAAPAAAQHDAAQYDVVLRGGRVHDGSGAPWIPGDVGIRDGRIVAVGDLGGAGGSLVLDVTGLHVAPGFIDTHSHAGGALATPERSGARPLLAQGITTVFVNPDGGGPVDLAAQREALLREGLGVNVAQLVPHGSVRREVLGLEHRAPTAPELERMRGLVRAGMEAGAFGLSSGPYYTPGRFATTDELAELAAVAASYGGAYQSHIRDESDYTVGVLAAVEEVIEVARRTGMPSVVTHVKALGPSVWGFSAAIVERIERARAEGLPVFADQYPYEASATSLTAALVPAWALAGGGDSLRARLARPEARARVLAEMEDNLARRGGADRIQFRHHAADRAVEGRTLAEVADRAGDAPVARALAMIEAGGAGVVSFNMHPGDVERLMRQPWTLTASDGDLPTFGAGVPHPRSYGTFPRKLGEFAWRRGVVEPGFALRSMTHLPALVYGLEDRGMLRPGMAADVVVFDPARLNDPATYADPHRLAEGMVHVLVNGVPAILHGAFTDARAGRVLRRP